MTRARTALGVLAVCALAACAFGAANASAKGLTAVTCVEGKGALEFNNADCEKEQAGGGFITQDIELNKTTEAEGDSAEDSLQVNLGGINATVTCETAHTTGHVRNIEEFGVMFAHGTEIKVDYTECHVVLAAKPEKTCEVEDVATGIRGTILTEKLTALTSEKEHDLTVKPEVAGGNFAKFRILASGGTCFTTKVIVVTVTGSIIGEIETEKPSHVTFEAAGGGNLRANGAIASYDGTHGAYMAGQPEHTIAAETR